MVVWKLDWKKPVCGPKCQAFEWSAKSHDFTVWIPFTHTVQYLDESCIQVFGIQMVTVSCLPSWNDKIYGMSQKSLFSGDLKSDLSKSRNIWKTNFLKIGFKMVHFSKDWAIAFLRCGLNHLKTKPFKIQTFLSGFSNGFLTKWRLFVRNSNGWAYGFQIPFQIQTICKQTTSFWPF